MSAKQLERNYPNLFNPELPVYLGCPKKHDLEYAKKAFKKICFKDVNIIAVEGYETNTQPACCWRVYYQMKSEQYLEEEGGNNSNVPPPDLPQDVKGFFENLTARARILDLRIIERKQKTKNTAVVEYYPRLCECQVPNFDEVESNLHKLKI